MGLEKVTIKATEEVRKLAGLAIECQDACNQIAVASLLQKIQRHFADGTSNGQVFGGSDMASQNPLTVAVINKLCHLAEMDQSRNNSYDACFDLREGVDVEWMILFRD